MDKLVAIKIKYDDETYSDEIPISALAENVEWDNTHTLVDVLGSVDVDVTGTIQGQINDLKSLMVSSGYTPVRGTDYWTAADKAEIVADVLAEFIDLAEVAQ